MKNLKKVLAILLLCAMSAMFLVSCSPTNKDWEDIGPKGKIIIGITDFVPMNYKDNAGNWTGFETEFAEAVCKIIGVTPQFQVIKWSAKETELKAKNIDCIWNGMTVTSERKDNMDYSQSYMINQQVLVTLAENEEKYKTADDLNGASVVAESGSTGEETAQDDAFFAGANLTPVDSQIKALLEVKAGTADVAVVDYLIAANAMGTGTDYENLVISQYKTFEDEEYAVFFRKNSPDTVKKVNDAINQMIESGELYEIATKYGLYELIIKG